jgi:hypothetical protein
MKSFIHKCATPSCTTYIGGRAVLCPTCQRRISNERSRECHARRAADKKAAAELTVRSKPTACDGCAYAVECRAALGTMQLGADGTYHPVPLRCFVDHPRYVRIQDAAGVAE